MSDFFSKYFVWENKWGIISGIIVVILGGISLFFSPSPEGAKLCQMLGMNLITESNHNSKIFSVSLSPPKFKRHSRLLVALAEKYQTLDISGMEPF